ncbi:HD domain-containing protein [Ktedonospora formicarum]|uniref:Phosphohydrolase n=1 Tax=Ktedonospora formicarum TaxID=2778364 RepID=A0A8J3I0T9_9CHLR|nr:HD domain-containing protein [Ktedonospora formicarum]GHO43998.1 phosphohydrolase [Ktedonospora formicarum]
MTMAFEEQRTIEAIYNDVKERFAPLRDLAHGWDHVERVYKLANMIGRREQGDLFIIGMAALMHDLGRTAPSEAGRHHADLSVTLARELMSRHNIPSERQEAIVHAIVAHSFSKGIEPSTLEAGVVRDADRLDGLGAIGVMRWAITGAVRQGRGSETTAYHPDDPFARQHPLDDERYMLDHFPKKLLRLVESMQTETGRSLAWRRTRFMEEYLDEFRKELELS